MLTFWGSQRPSWSNAALYVAAFGAQAAVDVVTTSTWSRIAYKVPVLDHVRRTGELIEVFEKIKRMKQQSGYPVVNPVESLNEMQRHLRGEIIVALRIEHVGELALG